MWAARCSAASWPGVDVPAEAVRVEGLKEFVRGLKQIDRGLAKAVRLAFNDAADVIVSDARGRVPSRSGRAKGSVKAKSTQTKARISGGGNRAPYYPWLDFGGRVGRRNSVKRPFLKDGRYIYAAYNQHKGEFVETMAKNLADVARQAGIDMDVS
jgi:hypothetical protein